MKEKILDKQVLRYVIATTVSGKPTYLKKKLQKIEYSFVTDIDNATKCSSYAIAETVKVDFSGKSGKSVNNVGYFISDGRPWDDPDTTKEDYSIGKDYQDQASWNKWETFIQNKWPEFYSNEYMLEKNKDGESGKLLIELKTKDIHNRNLTQGKDGVYSGYGTNPYYEAKGILTMLNEKLEESVIDELFIVKSNNIIRFTNCS